MMQHRDGFYIPSHDRSVNNLKEDYYFYIIHFFKYSQRAKPAINNKTQMFKF